MGETDEFGFEFEFVFLRFSVQEGQEQAQAVLEAKSEQEAEVGRICFGGSSSTFSADNQYLPGGDLH